MFTIRQCLLFPVVLVIAACSSQTKVSGTVYNQMGTPLPDVEITLGYSEALQGKAQTGINGEFLVILEETCLIICAGGNPELTLSKAGYLPVMDYVPRFQQSKRKYRLKLKVAR